MLKEFIPYEQALELKELGFDKLCYALVTAKNEYHGLDLSEMVDLEEEQDVARYNGINCVAAPLYQQAFRWFRENHGIFPLIETNIKNLVGKKWFFSIGHIKGTWELVTSHETYEEAELACLKKLIEIVKNKPQKQGRIQDISIG